MPVWMMRRREAVRDELGAALPPLLDQERVVVGDGLIESKSGPDAELIQHGKNAKDPDPIAVFVVAVAADIRKCRLVAGPQALGAAHGAHGKWGAWRDLPVPVLKIYDHGECDAGAFRPSENRAGDNGGPGIKILIHAVGSRCRHRSAPSLWFVPGNLGPDYGIPGDCHKSVTGAAPVVM